MYQKLLKTYSEVIKTKDLINTALSNISVNETTKNVLANLTVVPVADTQILEIKYKNNSPEIAFKVINSIKNEFIKQSSELVPNGNVKTLENSSLPEKPVSPNKKMNIAIAFLLGAMVGVGIVFLLEFLDNSFKTKKQLEEDLEIPVIGVIPSFLEENNHKSKH
ncbi:Putative Lipopolysaccharide biosynthesis protein [Clostridium chauvoei JF4335]|nr:Putative Lipopolysaccharide biosynthesis protein [Clostridium chauvoei JF4335]